MFTILIGSYARGTNRRDSDLDIVRIDHTNKLNCCCVPSSFSNISYIDYSIGTFDELHSSGSLFLYHIFSEGKLLCGKKSEWYKLRETFNVNRSFKKEINEYLDLLVFLNSDPVFHHSIFAYLSNMFKAIKNISIFNLAEKQQYIFEKKSSILSVYSFLSGKQIDLLISANDIFERDVTPPPGIEKELNCLSMTLSNSWTKFGTLLT